MMTARIPTCCTLLIAASEETPSEALLPALVLSEIATFGTAMVAEDPVIHTLEVAIHPQWVSAKCHAAAIFRVAITCPSGVTGVVVMEL